MLIEEDVALKNFTTFKTGGPASFFVRVSEKKQLEEVFKFAKKNNLSIFILGDGSNLLVSDEGYKGIVIKNEIKGFTNFSQKREVQVSSGEKWDFFVEKSLDFGYSGLENMSGIPGTIGGAIHGNIGAYGREVKDFIKSVSVIEISSGQILNFEKGECQFAYRDSVFKKNKSKYFILSAVFSFNDSKEVNIEYKDLKEYFEKKEIKTPKPIEVRRAVLDVRSFKLPDWNKIGTAGSFFKNPIVTKKEYDLLVSKFPNLPGREDGWGKIKIPLGYVIDKICGLRGFSEGKVGTYKDQALVLINEGGSASDIEKFAQKISQIVKEKTGIEIEREVEYVGK